MYMKILVNMITFSRVLLTLLFCYYAFTYQENITVISIIFLFVFTTDYFDGKLARRFKVETRKGAILDITVDLFFILASYLTLIVCNTLPAWALIVILLKFIEFLVTSSKARQAGICNSSGLLFDSVGKTSVNLFYSLPILAIILKNYLPPVLFTYIINIFIVLLSLMALTSSLFRVKTCFSIEAGKGDGYSQF